MKAHGKPIPKPDVEPASLPTYINPGDWVNLPGDKGSDVVVEIVIGKDNRRKIRFSSSDKLYDELKVIGRCGFIKSSVHDA